MDYRIIVYIIFGILPSLGWLAYYLRKDAHPEPKKTILKIFFWGCIITIPVFFVQVGLAYLLGLTNLNPVLTEIIYWFLIIGLSEEFFKYFVVKMKVLNNPDLDEPLDIMLYMVVSALGFSAVENILYLCTPGTPLSFNEMVNRTLSVAVIRFLGATFLHTLCSALVGYALAISFYQGENKTKAAASGIFMAMVLHGMYDFSIMTLGGYERLGVPVIIIITLSLLVFSGMKRVQKLKSICLPDK